LLVDKAERLIAEAAAQGSQLVVFPEAFIGGYPRGNTFGAVIGSRSLKGKEDFRKYHASAIDVPGQLLRSHRLLHPFRTPPICSNLFYVIYSPSGFQTLLNAYCPSGNLGLDTRFFNIKLVSHLSHLAVGTMLK